MTGDRDRVPPAAAAAQPLDVLCQEILVRHHAEAHIAVPRLRGQMAAIEEQEPGAIPSALPAIFRELADTLVSHLAKEENILFPALAALAEAERTDRRRPPLPFPTLLHPIRVMEAEHARLSAGLEAMAAVTAQFVPPESASEAVRRLMAELSRFRDQLTAHLQAENDVLFPQALELDLRL